MGKAKIWVSTQETVATTRQCALVYIEAVNMMVGLDHEEDNQYFEDNPKIIPLFEIDVVEVLTPYLGDDDKEADDPIDDKTIMESRH